MNATLTTRAQLLQYLHLLRDEYLFSIAAFTYTTIGYPQSLELEVVLGDQDNPALRLDLGNLADLLRYRFDSDEERTAFEAQWRSSHRVRLLHLPHELVKLYCDREKATNRLHRDAKFYRFAWIMRNSVSHGRGGVLAWPRPLKEAGVQFVEWRHRVLRQSDVGEIMTMGEVECYLLLQDHIEFVSTVLTGE